MGKPQDLAPERNINNLDGFKGDFTMPAQQIQDFTKGKTFNHDQGVENTHYWTSIKMLLDYLKYEDSRMAEHLKVGLENTLAKGYDIQLVKKEEKV